MILSFLLVAGLTLVLLLALCGLLHAIPKLASPGQFVSGLLCKGLGLDLVVTLFTIAPLVAGIAYSGWSGFLGGYVGQWLALIAWTLLHEWAHPEARNGPRIVKINNQLVGVWRNLGALWATSLVVPLFWFVRMAQIFVYPLLIWLVKFPAYRQGEWVNVSRHKFTGLVGHDRIWCLYCDWMTGVWSLGTEMLRNVESFWCPVRFHSQIKCDNCRHEFPDVVEEWVPANATMAEVAAKLEQRYITDAPARNAWFGHPVRLTVKGQTINEPVVPVVTTTTTSSGSSPDDLS